MIALPACAQRGGSRGGFSGHSASGSRGGFSASGPSRSSGYSSGYRGITAGRSPAMAPRFQTGLQRGMAGYPSARPVYGARPSYGARSPYTGDSRRRRPYVSPYGARGAYFAPGYGAVGLSGPYILDYPNDSGYDDSSAAQSPAPDGYDAGPPYPMPPEPPGIYPPAAAGPYQAPEVSSDAGVTLVFKDGRPPVEVHDYVLTRNTLYVWDRHQRVIPTDLLDLAATAKANEDAGIDFQLPEPPR